MLLYNTADKSYIRPLKHCVMNSLAPGKGLYMPCDIPTLEPSFFENIEHLSFTEMALTVAKKLIGDYIPEEDLLKIIESSLNFSTVLHPVEDNIWSLELWHGPSLAFKDYGARFMAALMSYFVQEDNKKLTILVATSGDTGGAVAFGFLDVPNIEVIILYPQGKVSLLQEKQLTTLGSNIQACEIEGTFDDCQALVKEAFSDADLDEMYNLSSANSINIARLIPQMFYYFEAYRQLKHLNKKIVCSVPSGNFGNITAGLLAYKMGLPIHHFIAATNVNNIVPNYLVTGIYEPKPSIATVSNAMDVGNPSNFIRFQELFNQNIDEIRSVVSGAFYTDEETLQELKNIYNETGYIAEPHGAIGHKALKAYLQHHGECIGIFLETAHPAKFEDVVNPTLGIKVPIPDRLNVLATREKKATLLDKSYTSFKSYLLQRNQ
jgi:threonine synthase